MTNHALKGTYTITVDGGLVVQVSIEDLKQRLIELHAGMRRNQETADRAFAGWGDLLRQVKDQVGHGHWGAILRACDVGERTAQRAMRISTLCVVNGRFDVTLAHTVMEAERQGKRATPNEQGNPTRVTDSATPGQAGTVRDTGPISPNGMGNPTVLTDSRVDPEQDRSWGEEEDDWKLVSEETIESFESEVERQQMRETNEQVRKLIAEREAKKITASPAPGGIDLRGEIDGTGKAPEARPVGVQLDMSVLYQAAERFRNATARVIERIRTGAVSVEDADRFTEMCNRL